MDNKKFIYFLSGLKGLLVLEHIIASNSLPYIVYADSDQGLADDSFDSIQDLCVQNNIRFCKYSPSLDFSYFYPEEFLAFAVGWRRLIDNLVCPLVVLHDSLLPKYRGFAPTVSQLINGEDHIGVSAFYASEDYDCGDIIVSRSCPVNHPCTIRNAFVQLSICYFQCIDYICYNVTNGLPLDIVSQSDLDIASYSIWRDEYDYFLDWSLPASKILRTIYALGDPFNGAQTMINRTRVNVKSASLYTDKFHFEEVHPGKIFKFSNGSPVVICGDGDLLLLSEVTVYSTDINYQFSKLRSRFYKPDYATYLTL